MLMAPTAVAGLVATAFGVVLVFPAALFAGTHARASGARAVPARELVIWLAVGVLVALGAVGIVAVTQRYSAAYTEAHGTPVTVTLPSECVQRSVRSGNGSTTCEDASWKVDGATVRGTLYASYSELTALGRSATGTVLTDKPVEAFAIGDTAVTSEYAGGDWFLAVARLPWWTALALPLALILWPFAVWRTRRARAAAGLPPRRIVQFKV
ncbi:hypothetical protein GCM10022251_22900 [Phytohabitans flavus]